MKQNCSKEKQPEKLYVSPDLRVYVTKPQNVLCESLESLEEEEGQWVING